MAFFRNKSSGTTGGGADTGVWTPVPNRAVFPDVSYATPRQYRADLNNIAKKYGLKLEYEDTCNGPPHNCRWTSTALIGEIQYGSGEAYDKGGAREAAAREAVEALKREGYI